MTKTLDRRRFLQGSAAVGGSIAMSGPLAALATSTAHGKKPTRVPGYGPLVPTPAHDTGVVHLALPEGFHYRVISRVGDPSTGFTTDPQTGETVPVTVPTPGVFDGMGAFPGPNNTTILTRNHEHRERAGELPVVVPDSLRYDPNPSYRGGNTKLVVGPDRQVRETIHILGGTSTNCAGGLTPWGTWISCEETFQAPSTTRRKHGYNFEIDASSDGPVRAEPIVRAGCFAHEATAWSNGTLYQTEDNGKPSGFYRYVPDTTPRKAGDLARSSGRLEAIKVKGVNVFNADTDATPGESYDVEWVLIDDPDPPSNTVKVQGIAKGMVSFSRLEGCWEAGGRIYFDSTSGGRAGAGQIWEYDPAAEKLRLIFESPDRSVMESPDNLVVVPKTGDIWLQEDGGGEQFVRGVTQEGEVYDFARGILNDSEFCGGCFSANGNTFFLNHQGGRGVDITDIDEVNESGGLTFAIWGPFARRKKN